MAFSEAPPRQDLRQWRSRQWGTCLRISKWLMVKSGQGPVSLLDRFFLIPSTPTDPHAQMSFRALSVWPHADLHQPLEDSHGNKDVQTLAAKFHEADSSFWKTVLFCAQLRPEPRYEVHVVGTGLEFWQAVSVPSHSLWAAPPQSPSSAARQHYSSFW